MKHKCLNCGYVHDDQYDGTLFSSLPNDWMCPICNARKITFRKMNENGTFDLLTDVGTAMPGTSERLMADVFKEIQTSAYTGKINNNSMDTLLYTVGFDDIFLLGAQLSRFPLDNDEHVNLKTIIGKNSKKPMALEIPIIISHMSFGSISKEAKTALAIGSAAVGTATSSGEGGILPEEREKAGKYVFEYIPNRYSATDENLRNSDAIEIKIGQSTKPGMGSLLPGYKVTEEIAKIREKPVGQDILSPSKFKEMNDPKDLKNIVNELRSRSNGRPIGVKIAASHIETDLEIINNAGADFVTIDGRGGATGSAITSLRDVSSVPTIFALSRARKYLDSVDSKMDLMITGGLRTSRDFLKAIAMGADAVAIASAALISIGCQRYRVCHEGLCPMGIATQDPALRNNMIVEQAAERVENFLNVSAEELRIYGRCAGVDDIHRLSVKDLCTQNDNISKHTDIRHAGK